MKIPDTMKAVVVYGAKDYRFETVPVPRPGRGEILVKIKATGVCASDVKSFQGYRVWGSEGIDPYIETPVTPGHEFIGEVVQLGEGAHEKYGLSVGDLAVSEQIVPCWKCRFCMRGQYWMCARNYIYGFKHVHAEGSWAEYMLYPSGAINYKVPPEIDMRHAAMIEPFACAIHAVERGEIQPGDVVAIAGMGPIGLCMLQVARLYSPRLLVALDVRKERLNTALKLGADLAINVQEKDPVKILRDATEGYGCDVYIEAAGSPDAVRLGLQALRSLGTFVEFSVHKEPTSVDWSIIGDVKELNVHGAHLGPYAYRKAIDYLLDERFNMEPIITHTLPLEDYKKAIEIGSSGEVSLKVLLIP